MTVLTADFEAGTVGNTIAAGDPGSATAWDSVVLGTSTVVAYDTTHVKGTKAAKLSTGGTSAAPGLVWSTALGTLSGTHYGRFYLYPSATASGCYHGVTFLSGASVAAQILFNPTGKIELWTGFALLRTSTITVPVNQWSRIEFYVVQSATVGQMGYRIYTTNADGSTADETFDSPASANTRASSNSVKIGVPTGNAHVNVPAFWLDNIVANAVTYPGSAVVAAATIPGFRFAFV